MREISRSALVPYTPEQMFALVADLERYPEFLPWCVDARVLAREDNLVTACLALGKAGVKESFTTRNLLAAPERMEMRLIDGPFKLLEGTWSFLRIRDKGTRIELAMRFEFANALTALLLSRSFEQSCNSLVDAFTQRARSIYALTRN